MNTTLGISTGPVAGAATGRLRVARLLSAAAIPLIALAAGAGLASPAVYGRNPATIIPALRGQDLVTLLALPALALALYGSSRGSARATLLWIGVLGYMVYTYTGAALAYYFAALTPLYVLLFSLTVFGMAAATVRLDADDVARQFDAATPRRAMAGFLALIGLLLALLELGQIAGYLASGELPAGVVLAGSGAYFVYGLDLGLVVPLAVLGAVWLWQRRPWGYVIAGVVAVKAATMGLALLAMNLFGLRAGVPIDAAELLGSYVVLALGGLAMSVWFLRHCRGAGR